MGTSNVSSEVKDLETQSGIFKMNNNSFLLRTFPVIINLPVYVMINLYQTISDIFSVNRK